MKLIIRERVNSVLEIKGKVYNIIISAIEDSGKIPKSIGQMKGDLITFSDANSPVRLPITNIADKVLTSDPTSPTGMKWGNGGGGGGGSGTSTVTLINNTGSTIMAGTIVVIDSAGNEREVKKASSGDTGTLFVSSDDYASGDDMECYTFPNTVCNVLCDTAAVTVGDKLDLSSSPGIAKKGSYGAVGMALTSKASGNIGFVKTLLNCYQPKNYTISSIDLIDGVSALADGMFYFYYEA